jgi:hypothetical protein
MLLFILSAYQIDANCQAGERKGGTRKPGVPGSLPWAENMPRAARATECRQASDMQTLHRWCTHPQHTITRRSVNVLKNRGEVPGRMQDTEDLHLVSDHRVADEVALKSGHRQDADPLQIRTLE